MLASQGATAWVGGVATLDASDGHRVGEPCPGLVGHLLGPGPRLPPEGAGGHRCMGAALERRLPLSLHSQLVEEASEGHAGALLLIWGPLLLSPIGSGHTCPGRLAQR